jgi:hypothetical protein
MLFKTSLIKSSPNKIKSSELLSKTFSGSRNEGSFLKITLYLFTICFVKSSIVAFIFLE